MVASASSGLASRSLWRISTAAAATATAAGRRTSVAGGLALEWRAAYATLDGSGPVQTGDPDERRPARPPGPQSFKAKKPTKQAKRQGRPRVDQRFTAPSNYASANGLVMATAKAAMDDPRGGIPFLYGTGHKGQNIPGTPLLAVPMPPQPDAYIDMGRNVIPPRPNAFQALPLPRLPSGEPSTSMHVRFSSQHVLHPWSMRYLEATTDGDMGGVNSAVVAALSQFPHVLAEPTRRRYADKNANDPLWWFVLVHAGRASGQVQPIRGIVQRSGMRRRVERAFREALRRRGYSASGQPLSSWPVRITEGERVPQPRLPLVGTVRIEGVVRPLLEAGFEKVVERLDSVVTALEYRLRKVAREGDVGHSNNERNDRNDRNNRNSRNPNANFQNRDAGKSRRKDADVHRKPEPLPGFEILDPDHF